MKNHLMLDMETFSTEPNAVITTFGVVKFDPWGNGVDESDGIYVKVDIEQQLRMGRHVSDKTIEWWAGQSDDVKDEAFDEVDRVSVEELIRQLNKMYIGCSEIWSQGPTFDMVILDNLYRQVGVPIPWSYYKIRDSRTLFSVHGDPRKKGRAGAHNALTDCIYQAEGVQGIYANCGIENKVGNHIEELRLEREAHDEEMRQKRQLWSHNNLK